MCAARLLYSGTISRSISALGRARIYGFRCRLAIKPSRANFAIT